MISTFKEYFYRLRFKNFPTEVPKYRQSGRTTRLVDKYIQELFQTGSIIKPKDHEGSHESDRILMKRIRDRLKREHPHIIDMLKVNNRNCISFFEKNKNPYKYE